MLFGISTAALYGRYETEDAVQIISGFQPRPDCMEVFLQSTSEYSAAFAREIKRRLNCISCTSVHPQGTQFENGMFSRSQRQRTDAMDTYLRVLDAAAIIGAARYIYHGRHTAQLQPLPFNAQCNADVIGPMCEEAAKRNIRVAWENVFWCQLTTPERVEKMRKLLPDVCFTLDIKQAMRAGVNPERFVPAMGEALCNVHLCDWTCDEKLCLPGEGIFDFKSFFKLLKDYHYTGPVILEPYSNLVEKVDSLKESLEHLRAAE